MLWARERRLSDAAVAAAATLAEVDPGHPLVRAGQANFIANYAAGLRAGEAPLAEALARSAHHLAGALGDMVNFLNPDRIVLTGWAFRQLGEWLLPAVLEQIGDQALPGSLERVDIVAMELPGNPVALGMGLFALEDFLAQAGVPGVTRAISSAPDQAPPAAGRPRRR